VFGWSRVSVQTGLHELRRNPAAWNGFTNAAGKRPKTACRRSRRRFAASSNPRPRLILPLNPPWRSPADAEAVRDELLKDPALAPHVPCRQPSARSSIAWTTAAAGHQARPSKKIAETDAIFDNIDAPRTRTARPTCLRISIDGKAKVSIGPSRGASSTRQEVAESLRPRHPAGSDAAAVRVLEVARANRDSTTLVGLWAFPETADFIVDVHGVVVQERACYLFGRTRLQIELDNGPQLNSSRTQFLKRLQRSRISRAGNRVGLLSTVSQQI